MNLDHGGSVGVFEPEPFGKYYLIDKIATGGMAEIFKAKTYSHGGFENLMAIKRILAHLGENEDFVEMFIDEAKVSVALQHANIIRIYDFGKILDNYFIAMECVDGKDSRNILRKLARRRQYLPVNFAAYIAHQVCRGLAYAHEKKDAEGRAYGIVHRDISPSNILVSYEGDVKIADFGIAKAELNTGSTDVGTLKGKFEYMSPEQARGKELDGRSDLFSLGICLHEILTGRRLFKSDSNAASLEKIKTGDIPSPSSLNRRVPEVLDRIVMKALSRDKDTRYKSAAEMQAELEAFLFPTTPDLARQEFARFMQSLFEDEIGAELARLQEGSKAAETYRAQFPTTEWNEYRTSTINTENNKKSWIPMLGLGLLVILFSVLASVAIVVGIGLNQTAPEPEVITKVKAPIVTTGTLDVTLFPPGLIFINDSPKVDENKQSLTLKDLEPGLYKVRVEAKGYLTHSGDVEVTAGATSKFIHRFKRPERTRTEPKPTETKPEVKPVEPPAAAEPKKTEDKPGKLAVGIIGGGWADVYINGKKLARTAPLPGHSLKPGKYTVRIVNPTLGLEQTHKVTVVSGQTHRLNISP